MRLAIFTDTYLPQVNGVAKTLGRLSAFLVEKKIPHVIFAPATKGGDNQENNVYTFASHDFFLYPECKISMPNYNKISDILEKFQPTLIHVTTPFPIGLLGLKYAGEHNIPAVASYHTNFVQYLEYYGLNFLKPISWNIFRWFHNKFQRNFCPSQETLRLLKRRGINNLEVWSRGVSLEAFHPSKQSEELRRKMGGDGKILLLYVGRLAPEKNIDVLLAALHSVNYQVKDKIHLALVGDGPAKEQLQAKAPENVTFFGYLQGDELAQAYASADIFVFPSVTETLGNVVLEAMASGLPVIAAKAGGIKDNLRHLENGLACQPRNSLSMAQAILTMVEDDDLRVRLAEQAFAYAGTRSWEAIFSKLVESYENVIEEYPRKRIINKVKGGIWSLLNKRRIG